MSRQSHAAAPHHTEQTRSKMPRTSGSTTPIPSQSCQWNDSKREMKATKNHTHPTKKTKAAHSKNKRFFLLPRIFSGDILRHDSLQSEAVIGDSVFHRVYMIYTSHGALALPRAPRSVHRLRGLFLGSYPACGSSAV